MINKILMRCFLQNQEIYFGQKLTIFAFTAFRYFLINLDRKRYFCNMQELQINVSQLTEIFT